MISELTHVALNTLLHKLYAESYVFKGISCDFMSSGYPGFSSFVGWEAHERWDHGSDIKKCLYKLDKTVLLPAIPEAPTSYASQLEAITVMLGKDKEILEFIGTSITATMKSAMAPPISGKPNHGDYFAAKCMLELYEEMLSEHAEVEKVAKKATGVKEPSGFGSIDSWLLDYYTKKWESKGSPKKY